MPVHDAFLANGVQTLQQLLSRRRLGRVAFSIEAQAAGSVILTAASDQGRVSRTVTFPAGHSMIRQRLRLRGRWLRLVIEAGSDAIFTLPDGLEMQIEEEAP